MIFAVNLVHLLLRSARLRPEGHALAVGKRAVMSYRDLASRVQRLGAGLKGRLGLKPGDRVALAMKNCPEYYELLFACWHAGLTAVPMNAKLHPKEFAYILDNSGAKCCFVTPELQSAVPAGIAPGEALGDEAGPPAEARPDDPAWLFYT